MEAQDGTQAPLMDLETVKRAMKLVARDGDITEFRLIGETKFDGKKAGTVVGYFKSRVKLIEHIRRSEFSSGIYITHSPVVEAIYGRAVERVKLYSKDATGNPEIARRRHLVFDCDPDRPKGTNSTDAQHEAAITKARAIRDYLCGKGWPEPLFNSSGNGAHLWFGIDLANDKEAEDLCKQCTNVIATLFDDPEGSDIRVTVDKSVANAARVLRVPGTVNRKADHTLERPQRLCVILEAPDRLLRVSLEQLTALANEPVPETKREEKSRGTRPPSVPIPPPGRPRLDTTDLDIVAYFKAHECYGHEWSAEKGISTVMCPWEKEHSTDKDAMNTDTIIFNGTDGRPPGFKCHHAHCVNKRLQEVMDLWPDATEFGATVRRAGSYSLTDEGNASRLVDRYHAHLRRCSDLGGWMAWTGKGKWEVQNKDGAAVYTMIREVQERFNQQITEIGESTGRTEARKHLATWQKWERMKATYNAAASRAELQMEPWRFDMDEYLLNCSNAVVDLRNGTQHEHKPDLYCTRQTAVPYDPDAKCDTFDQFLFDIFAGNADLIDFVWHAIGYSLTGSVREQVLFFCYGNGSNGKSTLLEVLRMLVGEYATAAAPGILMEAKGDRHPTELADLRGRRLVVSVETGEGKRMNEERVKQLTGGDQLKARFMRCDFFSFDPTHKLWLSSNHKPVIRGNDHAIWRRIPVIPFTVCFKSKEAAEPGEPIKDVNLLAKLKAELPGILAKAVQYAKSWHEKGLPLPACVQAEVDKYRDEMDSIGSFIEARCQKVDGHRETAADLYREYKDWCDETGEYALTQARLGVSLQERGFNKIKTMGNSVYIGLRLVSLAERTVL